MAAAGMNNLTTLIKRLEAATSRLEDIASTSQPESATKGLQPSGAAVTGAASVNGDGVGTHQPSGALAAEDLPRSIEDFDALLQDDLKPFSDLGQKLGSVIGEQTALFEKAFKAQRRVLLVADKAKEPDPGSSVFLDVLKELTKGIEDVNGVRDRNRRSPEENHLSMLADGVSILAWVTYKHKPDEYVGEVLSGAKMYGNRVLSAHKDKDKVHADYVSGFVRLCESLKSYIKENYPRGLSWKPNGIPAEQALKDTSSDAFSAPPAPSAGGPPPPPPPPMPPAFDIPQDKSLSNQSSSGDMGAVFQDLNKGEAVTAGLKKVDKSQMTHKNPSIRTQAPVPVRSDSGSSRGKSPAPNKKPSSMRTKKPPRKELDGNKWLIENFENESAPIEINAERQQSILVTKCQGTALRVHGKANAIAIDNCTKFDVIVDSLVSSVEVVNSAKFQLQVLGTLPAVQLDKVDGAIVYLSKESLQTEILTSNCTSVNITLPPATEADDSTECPVPEQFKTSVVDGKLVSEIVKQEG
ncbi:MAG: hypothetical protein M1828_006941 [Chrysothrix sp. TS-e1954]|nr:MAG: hypothetical protein M1828_006941 [Chrysothrix sp. TS-e1954]